MTNIDLIKRYFNITSLSLVKDYPFWGIMTLLINGIPVAIDRKTGQQLLKGHKK